jgi:transposase
VNLVDARGTKNVPGRKTDVQECQWLLKLHTYGLLRSCFLPSPKIHGVRTMWRLRDQHVKDAGREIQHMQKALIEMNVHLHNAISDLGRGKRTGYDSRHCEWPTRSASIGGLARPAHSSQ